MPIEGGCNRFGNNIAKNGQEDGKLEERMSNIRGRRAKNPLSTTWANNLLAEAAKGIHLRENPKRLVVRVMLPNQLYSLSSMGITRALGRVSFSLERCQYVTKSTGGEQTKTAILMNGFSQVPVGFVLNCVL